MQSSARHNDMTMCWIDLRGKAGIHRRNVAELPTVVSRRRYIQIIQLATTGNANGICIGRHSRAFPPDSSDLTRAPGLSGA